MKFLFFLNVVGLLSVTGNPVERISGGNLADISEFPFATALLSNLGDGAYRQVCGGTIISNTAILTAASCFFTNTQAHPVQWWRARVGSTYSNTLGLVYLLRAITTHPNFNTVTRVNDIAVVRTVLNIAFSQTVQAAHIAGGAYSLVNNQAVVAIGWGATANTLTPAEELRKVEIFVVDQQTCLNRYNEIGFSVANTMLCAGWLDVGVRGQCQGDTGSPLLHNNVVIGVYSWTEGCGASRHPNINTRVSDYSRWIETTAVAAVQ